MCGQRGDISEVFSSIATGGTKEKEEDESSGSTDFDLKATLREVQSLGARVCMCSSFDTIVHTAT